MNSYTDKKSSGRSSGTAQAFSIFVAFIFMSFFAVNYANSADPVIVELHQTPCTIIEAEENPQVFISNNIEDCKRINKV